MDLQKINNLKKVNVSLEQTEIYKSENYSVLDAFTILLASNAIF